MVPIQAWEQSPEGLRQRIRLNRQFALDASAKKKEY
jgi:hypothetical protein